MDVNPTEYVFDCPARLRKNVEGRFRVTRNNQIHFISTGDPIIVHIAKIEGTINFVITNIVIFLLSHSFFVTNFMFFKNN